MNAAPLFAQDLFRLQPEHFIVYVLFTLFFLFVAWLIHNRTNSPGTTLILWGVLVVVLACGYGLVGVPMVMMHTPALVKIGFLLVLGGVACSMLASCPTRSASKESDHV